MENYKELEVWKKAIYLVIEIYKITKSFPPEERYGLASQVQRAVVSVPANIAEGWGRGSTREYIRYLRISKGSLMELETYLIISEKLDYISRQQAVAVKKDVENIGRMTNSLISRLTKKVDLQLLTPNP